MLHTQNNAIELHSQRDTDSLFMCMVRNIFYAAVIEPYWCPEVQNRDNDISLKSSTNSSNSQLIFAFGVVSAVPQAQVTPQGLSNILHKKNTLIISGGHNKRTLIQL